jgi:hypothetical protein
MRFAQNCLLVVSTSVPEKAAPLAEALVALHFDAAAASFLRRNRPGRS